MDLFITEKKKIDFTDMSNSHKDAMKTVSFGIDVLDKFKNNSEYELSVTEQFSSL
jgi:hypothetical protein